MFTLAKVHNITINKNGTGVIHLCAPPTKNLGLPELKFEYHPMGILSLIGLNLALYSGAIFLGGKMIAVRESYSRISFCNRISICGVIEEYISLLNSERSKP